MEWLIIALLLVAVVALLLRDRRRAAPPPAPRPPAPPSTVPAASDALYETSLQSIDVGVAIVDESLRVRFCNQHCLELLGRSLHEVLGHSAIVLLRDHWAESLVKEVLERREERVDVLRPVLNKQTINFRCLPLQQGGALLLLRDMTRLSQLERARRDLIANVSHDLRTPLTSLRLLLETLRTQPPPAVAGRMMSQMQGEIDDLIRLVDKLNELARIESGRLILQLQPQSPAALIERALERISLQASRHSLRLDSSAPDQLPQVLVDQEQIEQALLNLLQNALKFTPSGGTISVTATPAAAPPQTDGNGEAWVEIVVRDTGPGIPPEDLPRIFERFYKVDRSRTRGSGGMGLGLAIAKHIVEGHGGSLWADSTMGEGSHFHILLPVAR